MLQVEPESRGFRKIYMAERGELQEVKEKIVNHFSTETALWDVAADFGIGFMVDIAPELLTEAGWGVLGAMCIPVIGAAVGAALDYLIATQMTWRVGTMVSIYFQNGDAWVGSQKEAFGLAKEMTGSLHIGLSDLPDGKFKNHTPRTDLNNIRKEVPSARDNLLRNVRTMVSALRAITGNVRVREVLKMKGIPLDLIDQVLA